MNINYSENDLVSQNDVAKYFNVTGNTIKNWRERGLLSYFKAPGSNRPMYYRSEIERFQETHTRWRKEEKKNPRGSRVKPRLSSGDDWRIS